MSYTQDEVPLPEGAHRARLGVKAKRSERQRFRIRLGYHPLSPVVPGRALPLHPDADRSGWRPLKGHARGPRCGDCKFLDLLYEGEEDRKCMFDNGRRVTRGAATTVRLWWPACRDFQAPPREDTTASGDASGGVGPVPGL